MNGFFKFMREHETGIIEIAAVVTSSLRWVITFMPVDGVAFDLAESPVWKALSAFLSVAFAVVEVYATAFMMRAWNKTKDARDRSVLFVLWIISLAVMVVVQFPPLYANVMRVDVNTLPQWSVIAWIVSVAVSTFVVIAGVSYADGVNKQKAQTTQTSKPVSSPYTVEPRTEVLPAINRPQIAAPKRANGNIPSDEEFSSRMVSMGDSAPKSVSEVEAVFGLSHATAARKLKTYRGSSHGNSY